MMHDKSRIPRWLVEKDPSWEKSIDSDFGMLKWTKKGTGIQATCQPTSIFCDITGQTDQAGLHDISALHSSRQATQASGVGDIAKYLSSIYLNASINGPRFDLRKVHKF